MPVYRHRRWAHLWSDTGDRQELDGFAARIGLKPQWIQIRLPYEEMRYHYDLVPSKHKLALQAGAILTDELAYWREKGA